MISAGEIGATLTIVDGVSAVLDRISIEFERLDGVIKQTKESLANFAAPGLSGINRSLTTLDKRLTTAGDAAARTANELVAGFGRAETAAFNSFEGIDKSVDGSIERVKALKTEMANVGKVAAADDMVPLGAGGGGRRRPPGAYGPDGERLPAPHRGGGLHGRARLTSSGLETHVGGSASDTGGLMEMLGIAGLLEGVKKILDAGGEQELAKKKLSDRLGTAIKPGDIEGALKVARDLSIGENAIPGVTTAGALTGIGELLSTTPSLESAEETYGPIMRSARLLQELTGKKADTNVLTLSKALELLGGGVSPQTGKLDPARMIEYAQQSMETFIAGGGMVDANTILNFAKQAGGMGRMTSNPDALFNEVISSLIDQGGYRTGTGLTALGRQFVGNKMLPSAGRDLDSMHLMPEGWEAKGGGVIMPPGGHIKGFEEIMDPNKGMAAWIKDIYIPALTEKLHHAPSVGEFVEASYKDFSTVTAQKLGLIFGLQQQQQERDIGLRHQADPNAAFAGIATNDYPAALNNLGAAITSFGNNVGGPAALGAIKSLNLLSDAIHLITEEAIPHPKVTTDLVEGAAVTGFAALLALISKWVIGTPSLPDIIKGSLKAIPEAGSAALGVAGLASLTSPDEQKILDKMIADEQAKAAASIPVIPVPRMPEIDPGIYERSKRASDAFRADPEAAHARALSGMVPNLAPNIQGSLQTLPGQVQPAITSAFASIGAAISSAIAGLAASAKAAAGAIQTGGSPVQVHSTTVMNVDGRKLSEAVGSHIITANASVNNSAAADTTSMPGWTDMGAYA